MASELHEKAPAVTMGPETTQRMSAQPAVDQRGRGMAVVAAMLFGAQVAALFLPWLALPFVHGHGTLNYWETLSRVNRIESYTGERFFPLMLVPLTLALALLGVVWARFRSGILGLAALLGIVLAGWLFASLSSVSIMGISVDFSGILQAGFWVYALSSLLALLAIPVGAQGPYLAVSVFIAVADQLLKALMLHALGLNGAQQVVIPGVLSFHVIQNTGAAFGLFQSLGPLLALITVLMIYAGYKLVRDERDPFLLASLSLILGGAVGNLVDRIFRQGVIDYIEVFPVTRFPLFNLADAMITLGTAGIIIHGFIKHRRATEPDASHTA